MEETLKDDDRWAIARGAAERALRRFPAARAWYDDIVGDAMLGVVEAESSHDAGKGSVRKRACSLAYWAALKSAKSSQRWEAERQGKSDRLRVYAETRRAERLSRGELDQSESVNDDMMDRRPPLAGLDMAEYAEGLADAMHALSDIQRGMVDARHREDLSLRTIADRFNTSVSTVHRTLGDAYAVLAVKLKEFVRDRAKTGRQTPHPPDDGTPTGAPHNGSPLRVCAS